MDAGIAFAEGAQHFRCVIRSDRADMQGAPMEPAERAQRVAGLTLQIHDPPGNLEQCGAGLRQLDPPAAPMEKLDVEHLFERADLAGQRRLADVEHARRRGESPFRRHGVEGSELRKYHWLYR